MFEWRSETSSSQFNTAFNGIMGRVPEIRDFEIPKNEKLYRQDKTFGEEIRHALLLKTYREFQNGAGVMQTELDQIKKHLTFVFEYCNNDDLITSDTPAYIADISQSKKMVLVALPNLVVTLALKDPSHPDVFKKSPMNEKKIEYYNALTYKHADKLLLSKKEITAQDIEKWEKSGF